MQINIASHVQRQILEEILDLDNLFYVHFGPPCGTASAARSIRLHRKRHGPPPLRSWARPMGLDNLSSLNQLRVDQANFLYSWTCKMIDKLHLRKVHWSVENPAGSLMWATDPFLQLQKAVHKFAAFSFHTCMFQSERKKDTALWTSMFQLQQVLERKCDGKHLHLGWGVTNEGGFATAEETAYNDTLASTWAQAVADVASHENIEMEPTTMYDTSELHVSQTKQLNKAFLGALPRGRRVPPVMSDLLIAHQVDVQQFEFLERMSPNTRISDEHCKQFPNFPKGSRLLRFGNESGVGNGNEQALNRRYAIIGFPREPWVFVQEALNLIHPTLQSMRLQGCVAGAIEAQMDPVALRKNRILFMKKLIDMRNHWRTDERKLHDQMEPHLKRVLDTKNILMFKELLRTMNYPDDKLADELAAGFPLYGWLPPSGVFPGHVKPPELHPSALLKMSASFSKRATASVKSSGDVNHDLALWEATMSEVGEGYVTGPFDAGDVPKGALVVPRFGLQQKNKLRPIDNYTAAGTNLAVGTTEKLQIDSIDELAAMIKGWMQIAGKGLELVGRTFDLRKAYRQIGICREHLHASWFCVWCPSESKVKYFHLDSMPFGATASVSAFLRISLALKMIGIYHCNIIWTSFYDDYICVCKKGDEQSTGVMIQSLFSSLGWVLSSDPEKDKDFSTVFQALGVEVDLTCVPQGYFQVSNTGSRKVEVSDAIDAVLGADALGVKESIALRSRLTFAESQIFGRTARLALHSIGEPGRSSQTMRPLTSEMIFFLKWMKQRVLEAPPRRITVGDRQTWFLYLDGACSEPDDDLPWSGTSVGGVLIDHLGNPVRFFGEVLEPNTVVKWGAPGQKQFVFEAETLPYAIALYIWRHLLQSCCVFVFIDNEAAKSSWIAGVAHSDFCRKVIHGGTMLESDLDVWPYFCRVPTFSNVADWPSRGDFTELIDRGAVRDRVDIELIHEISEMM